MHYPPFNALANVLIRSDKMEDALKYSGLIGKWFETVRHEGIRVLGPAAAPIVRLKRDYRYHFLLKAASREKLNSLLRTMLAHAQQQKIPRTNIIIADDPWTPQLAQTVSLAPIVVALIAGFLPLFVAWKIEGGNAPRVSGALGIDIPLILFAMVGLGVLAWRFNKREKEAL